MSTIDVLDASGAAVTETAEVFHRRLDTIRRDTALPFAPERLERVASVGQAILKASRAGVSPFVTHFAFWIRAGALQKLAAGFHARLPAQSQARARGLVFHLPPQNVETVFLYSWILSYLAGNANVIRLPGGLGAEMQDVCGLFLERLAAADDATQLFVRYPSASSLSAEISARSDARVVWGGDAKVAAFATMPLRHGGKALWFGDRFSFSLVDGRAVADLDDAQRAALAKQLYNDIFIFDQMACSSPHVLYVLGTPGTHGAGVDALLDRLALEARGRGTTPATGHAIRKMVGAFAAAARGEGAAIAWRDNELTRVVASRPDRLEERIGGGYLRLVYLSSLAELPALVREHDQTVTHFGFSAPEIADLAGRIRTGVTRWAPIGSALDFDHVWDGYDIPVELTKLVRVS